MVALNQYSSSDGTFDKTGNIVMLKTKHHIKIDFTKSPEHTFISWYKLEIMEMPIGITILNVPKKYNVEGTGDTPVTYTCPDDKQYMMIGLKQYREVDMSPSDPNALPGDFDTGKIVDTPPIDTGNTGNGSNGGNTGNGSNGNNTGNGSNGNDMTSYNMIITIAVVIAIVIVMYLLFKHGIITKEHVLGGD